MSELDAQIANRREKKERLRAAGIDPYPHRYDYDLEPSEVHDLHGQASAGELAQRAIRLRVPGRVRGLRGHGKITFLDLQDGRGRLQVMVRRDRLAPTAGAILDSLDLGDYLGASGTLMRTRTGELTLAADELTLLAKALRPLPEKWHGLTDVEARYRQRYLDLMVNPDSRRIFEVRASIVRGLRRFLDERGFLEVETPMMQRLAGGAAARPFVTHHNALSLELYLRVAPELFLKRLLVGGFHRVYEINRNFRNEGISTQHNPEFTMLEFYWAYVDYRQLMELTEQMVVGLAEEVLGRTTVTWEGQQIELRGESPWPRYSIREAVERFAGIPADRLDHPADLAPLLAERQIPLPLQINDPGHPVLRVGSAAAFRARHQDLEVPEGWYGHLLMALFGATVESELVAPTFITGFPVEVSPLAKQDPSDPRFTERFELYLGRMEIANAFSELNDPEVQAQRFREQLAARELGDQLAHRFDRDYVQALEHGMPPAAGEGVGVDRLVMLFTDSASIRDVILFPLLRPLPGEDDQG